MGKSATDGDNRAQAGRDLGEDLLEKGVELSGRAWIYGLAASVGIAVLTGKLIPSIGIVIWLAAIPAFGYATYKITAWRASGLIDQGEELIGVDAAVAYHRRKLTEAEKEQAELENGPLPDYGPNAAGLETSEDEPQSPSELFNSEVLSRAVALLGEGTKWKDIYPVCIENYDSLSQNVRTTRQRQLKGQTRRLLVRAMKAGG